MIMTMTSLSLSQRSEPARLLRDIRGLMGWRHRRLIEVVKRLRRWAKL